METIGPFQIGEELGRGAMGVVFRGFDPAIGRPVAIKIIRSLQLSTAEEDAVLKLRFAREAAAAGKLSHSNIVTIYHMGEHGGSQYMVMELVSGRSLEQMLEPGVPKGDILYTKVGATFGYAAVNNFDYAFSIFVSLALLKPVAPLFSSAYAELVMNSEFVFNQARESVSGIGTPDLHLIEIRDFRAPLPPLEEQCEIVRRVEALFKLADKIEERVAVATKRADMDYILSRLAGI